MSTPAPALVIVDLASGAALTFDDDQAYRLATGEVGPGLRAFAVRVVRSRQLRRQESSTDTRSDPDGHDGLMSRSAAARQLGLSLSSLDRRVRAGEIKATRIGARVLFARHALDEYVVRPKEETQP